MLLQFNKRLTFGFAGIENKRKEKISPYFIQDLLSVNQK